MWSSTSEAQPGQSHMVASPFVHIHCCHTKHFWLSSQVLVLLWLSMAILERFPRPNDISSISLRPVVNVLTSRLYSLVHPLCTPPHFIFYVIVLESPQVGLSSFSKKKTKERARKKGSRFSTNCSQHQHVYLLDWSQVFGVTWNFWLSGFSFSSLPLHDWAKL